MLQESTGWRDEALSRRHREWGVDCPAVDVDCLLVEFDLGVPVAVIEYKHHNLRGSIPIGHPMYRALTVLSDRADIPMFVAYYWPGVWSIELQPVNAIARGLDYPRGIVCERTYVRWLYVLRSRVVRDELLPTLSELLPVGARAMEAVG